jgi:hypothetical protein
MSECAIAIAARLCFLQQFWNGREVLFVIVIAANKITVAGCDFNGILIGVF